MPKLTVEAVRGVATINGKNYPMYCGFLSAKELKEIAEVPSFLPDKPHHQIATDISQLPVDQWQRPLENHKTNAIKDTYSRADKDNLMANPVLIGIANLNINTSSFVSIDQKTLRSSNGEILPVENYFTISINHDGAKKPLWILDGQHRVEGLSLSQQKNEPMPFVLLYDDRLYTPPFLAEIFTQVTTGATPMKPLHAEWMKYAFRLDKYAQAAYESSMGTVIALCKEVQLDGETNPFHNKIQFNPYLPLSGYFAFQFDMSAWVEMIASNYYGRGGTLSPVDLAAEIVKATRALEDLDQYRNRTSKLFSSNNPHPIFAEGFLSGLLKYLSITNAKKTLVDWTNFYIDPIRAFNRCRWDLPFVRTPGAMSSNNGIPSKVIAKECFDLAFSDPSGLNGTLLTDYLQGVGSQLRLSAYAKTSAGRLSTRDALTKLITPGSGLVPVDLNEGGVRREVIRIEGETPNCHIVSILDPNVVPATILNEAQRRSGLDVSHFSSGHHIEVRSMSYSGDTTVATKIRLDK